MTTRTPEIGRQEVARLVSAGALLIEVLGADEYEREHISGAVNVPLARLGREAGRLPRDRAIVVYCWDYQ